MQATYNFWLVLLSVGVAILGAVLASSISATGSTLLSKNTVIPDAIKPAIQSNFDAGSASSGSVPTISIQGGGSGQPSAGGPPSGSFPSIAVIGQEIKSIYDVAATDGTRNAARVASFFVLMGACSSLLIPGRRRETEELEGEMEGEPAENTASEASDVAVVSEPTAQANC